MVRTRNFWSWYVAVQYATDNICWWCTPRSSACYISCKRPENYSQRARSLAPQSAGCISTKSLVQRINDEKMDIGTMGKHLYKLPNNWLIWKNFSCWYVRFEHNKQMASKHCFRRKTLNWFMFPQFVLVGFNLLMFLLISHLRMLLDNSLRSILRRTCNSILKGKSVPLKEEY